MRNEKLHRNRKRSSSSLLDEKLFGPIDEEKIKKLSIPQLEEHIHSIKKLKKENQFSNQQYANDKERAYVNELNKKRKDRGLTVRKVGPDKKKKKDDKDKKGGNKTHKIYRKKGRKSQNKRKKKIKGSKKRRKKPHRNTRKIALKIEN